MYNINLKKKNNVKRAERGEGESSGKKQQQQKSKEKGPFLSGKQENYKAILKDISGTLKAVLLDKNGKELKKIPVRELTDELKKSNNIAVVVFDGVITQRLLDIASDKGVNLVVGIKLGNVIKKPSSVSILTRDQLQ